MCWFATLGTALGASTATATAVGAAATSGIISGLQFIGARQQARATKQYQEIAAKQEQQRFLQEQSAMLIQQQQRAEAANAEAFELQQRAKASMSRARVAAGEAGVAGISVDALINDYFRQQGNLRYAQTKEQGYREIATGLALQDAAMRSQQNLIGIRRPVSQPSLLEGVTSIASAGMQGYSQGMQMAAAQKGVG